MKPSSFLVFASFLSFTYAAQFKLYHRVFHPIFSTPYVERASITISGDGDDVVFQSASSLSKDLLGFSDLLQSVDNVTSVFYQVALQHEGDISEAQWDFSSVKLCHLQQTTSQNIYLYVTDQGKLYALDYFVSPIPHDGSCPKTKKAKSLSAQVAFLQEFSKQAQQVNTTVLIRRPSSPPLPQLKTPPPLTPQGEVVQPVPEKSFLQKYWMYLAIGLVAIALSAGPDEEPGPRRAA